MSGEVFTPSATGYAEFGPRPFKERYDFLLSSRWIGLMVMALIASTVTALLGFWQWNRYEEKAARLERIEANWDAPVTTIDDVLRNGLAVTTADEWRRVELTGSFLPESTAIRGRPQQSRPALLPIGVFLAERDGGQIAVLVNLGWLPAEEDAPPVPETTEVEVRLRLEEPPSGRTAPDGQAYSFNTGELLSAAGLDPQVPVLQGWAAVTTASGELQPLPDPDKTLGNHLSYAFQWWFFALAIPVGLVILARREAMDDFAMAIAGISRARVTDEDIEDAQVESQAK